MNANEAVARAWLEAWNRGAPEALDAVCADNYIEYDPASPTGRLDRDGAKRAIAMYKTASPDLQFTVQDTVAANDKVAVYWRLTATNLATGKHGETDGMTLMRVSNGQAVEARTCWDVTGFRQQLGMLEVAVPSTAPP